ncbi:ParB/Srx family N-terminal domain-containing protein [Haloferula sp. A504]|uniref:ParB/Srx family N-terminal domain-containing protein n=1 Tax=Haloferula sp. A504 TaxID=3373601 RepID=UPI0031BF86A7|nr:ParB/Srx family N-terminal domain-containing protein [Verrucomicrobiaceae bacterium E54]
MADDPKARTLANGIEVWCSFDKLVPVGELKPNPRNPNTHPQRQVELLAKNIRYFGWRQTITVSKRSGLIVSGHGRLMAAKHLGVEVVPVDYQDFNDENDELAVLVADNRLAELSTVDLNELEKIAGEWKATDFDTILAGFEPADLDALLNPDADEEDDDDRHDKELDKSEVTVAVGLYRFRISQDDFVAWCDRVKQDAGFDKDSVIQEIRNRLDL